MKALRPELGLLQLAPRPVVEEFARRFVPGGRAGWSAVGVDEFLRAYLQPRGRAAFYAALRNIYLDEPEGEEGFWTRLRSLESDSLFVWGRSDRLVPIAFARHVREALPRGAAPGAGVRACAAAGGAEGDACGGAAVLGGEGRPRRSLNERQRRQARSEGSGATRPSSTQGIARTPLPLAVRRSRRSPAGGRTAWAASSRRAASARRRSADSASP